MKATTITRTIIAMVVVVFAVSCGTTSYNTGAVPPVERRVIIVPGHQYGYGGYYGANRYRRPPVYYRQHHSSRPPVIIRERPRVIRQKPQYRSNEKRYTPARPSTPQNNNRYTQPQKPKQNDQQRPARVYRPNRGQ